jgi:5-methylcytosine-specific restriction enzyme subunit McrC
VTSETLSWHDEIGSALVPQMRTDVSIEWAGAQTRRLVLDTKYYGKTLSHRFANVEKFHSAHLYQLYAYLRTQEHRGEQYMNCPGLLLYPTTSGRIDQRMRVQGHEIRVATLDLAQPWVDIERDLLALVGDACAA